MNALSRRSTPVFLFLAIVLSGCAGGWRNGQPPGDTVAASAPAAGPSAAARTDGAPGTTTTSNSAVFVWKGAGSSVAVAGEFNGWNTSADPLTKQADGTWTVTKKLEPGRYQYKFVIDGGTWKEDPNAPETVDDGYGGKNAVVVIGQPSGGSATGGASSTATPAQPTTPTGNAKPPHPTADGVIFTFAGDATSLFLAGEFNSWSPTADPMKKQADGTWIITKKLAPGTYSYKFVVNGTVWKHDDANPSSADDGFGGKNSVVTVP